MTQLEGWTSIRLNDIAQIKRGAGSQYLTYVDEGTENSIRLIRISDFLGDSPKFIARTKDIERFILAKGDILIAGTGATAGIVFEIPDHLDGLAFSYNAPRIRTNKNVSKAFVAYYLKSSHVLRQQQALFTGNAQPFLDTNAIGGFRINLPPLAEQKKIAQILSTWDQAIATTQRLLDLTRQQKKALMQQLLTGKKRFPVFEGAWKKVKLSSVAEMNSGGTPKSSIDEYFGGEIPWVSIADMTKHGKWIETTEKTLTQLGLENSAARLYPPNTILYAMYASIGECSIAKRELCSSQAILGIRPKPALHYEFLYFYLASLKDKIKLQGQQGTQANLNAGMVKDFTIYLPSIQEQQKIAHVLNTADQEIETLQSQLDSLKQEKKALMQALLNGKRRVNVMS